MTKYEKRIFDWIIDHIEIVLVITGTLLAIYIRFCLRGFVSVDMENSLIPWYGQFAENGGFRALSGAIGDYNIPYQVFIALMTYTPIKPIYGYKMFSCFFDLMCACVSGWFVWKLTDSKIKGAISYVITICFPMVFINSSMWGQCDSIYAFFCICSIACYYQKKYDLCFIMIGFGLAFKLQAIFILPVMLFLYAKERKFSIWKMIWIPIPIIILSFPAIVCGRPMRDILSIYRWQTDSYQFVSLNYPSFWNIIVQNHDAEHYYLFKGVAVTITVLVLMLFMAYFMSPMWTGSISGEMLISISFLFTYTCVLFLPSMHERYDYLPLMLGLMLTFLKPRTSLLYLALSIINLKDYSAFLFAQERNWELLAVINVVVFACYVAYFFREDLTASNISYVVDVKNDVVSEQKKAN